MLSNSINYNSIARFITLFNFVQGTSSTDSQGFISTIIEVASKVSESLGSQLLNSVLVNQIESLDWI